MAQRLFRYYNGGRRIRLKVNPELPTVLTTMHNIFNNLKQFRSKRNDKPKAEIELVNVWYLRRP